MSWLVVAIIGYFFNAISVIVDKSLLNKRIPQPVVYTFYISLLGMFAFLLAPFGLHWVGWQLFLYCLLAGFLFSAALLAMFYALKSDEVSRVSPVIGGFQPIFVLFLSYFIVQERLSFHQVIAFILIVSGSLLISMRWQLIKKAHLQSLLLSLLSAFLFAATYTLSKYIYDSSDFISGFIWSRLGSLLAASLLLFSVANRKAIFHNAKQGGKKAVGVLIFGQIAGAISGIMVHWAVSLGSVTLVNALQGLQYVFLFIMILLLAGYRPSWLREEVRGWILVQKIISILLIVGGIYLLA